MRIAGSLLLFAVTVFGGEPPGEYFENKAFGFKIRVPKDWREVPAPHTWIACKHLGKRELEAQRGNDYWSREAPELWIVAFPHAAGGTENPYASYRDFLSQNDQFINFSEGYEIVEEKETTVGDLKVTTYDIQETKTERIPHHVVAWVYHFDDFDFAVQFKVFEWHYKDYDTSFRGCLKSFKRIDRTEAVAGTGAAAGTPTTRADILKLPADKRMRAMKDAVEARLRREAEGLPSGWKSRRTKKFLVVTNADDKFVKAAIDHAEAIADHLDDFFGPAGAEYVAPSILRIFATTEERAAYTAKDEGDLVREVSIGAGHGWEKDNAWEELNKSLWSEWLLMRNPGLEATLPQWFRDGLNKYMTMLRTKGKRIGFANDDWDRDEIRLQIKRGGYEDLLALLSREFTDLGKPGNLDQQDRERQVRVAVLWLMRQGNSGKTKNVVRDLVQGVAAEIDRVEAEILAMPAPKEGEKPTVESKRIEIRKNAWNKVLGGWDEGDWNRLNTAWLGFSK
ncbi:MAG TPA: hypothetical protein VFY93_08570 [Planctomycetota bacterium]|nr:hypothetical protein [Planctomycetota bacterium]